MTEFLRPAVAGLLVQRELDALGRAFVSAVGQGHHGQPEGGEADSEAGQGHRPVALEEGVDPVEALDHRHLNDVDGLSNPTSEMIAIWIWNRLTAIPGLTAIVVHETCTARCVYRGTAAD